MGLLIITHCWLPTHEPNIGPVAGHVICVANLMSKAIVPHMGKLVINARALIIPKLFVIPR